MISTKGRYALRVMVDIAENSHGSFISLSDIAERQDISKKYLESVMALLVKAKLVDSGHGKGGGYCLKREPDQYSVLEILEAAEESLAPVACLKKNAEVCKRCSYCSTLPMWKEVDEMLKAYFGHKTIADLMNRSFDDYSI